MESTRYSIANQPQRFAQAKSENNQRVLDIDSVYRPDFQGKTVLITGNFFFYCSLRHDILFF